MSYIKTAEDVPSALNSLIDKGMISDHEKEATQKMIQQTIDHPLLTDYFRKGVEVRNEQEIIAKNGLILRPDRMVFKDEQVTVIDYKTGSPQSSHKEQLNTYGEALIDMGYTLENTILVYIDQQVEVEII